MAGRPDRAGHHRLRRQPRHRGLTEKYEKHLDAEGKSGQSGKAYLLGKIGYVAKGIAIAIVGG